MNLNISSSNIGDNMSSPSVHSSTIYSNVYNNNFLNVDNNQTTTSIVSLSNLALVNYDCNEVLVNTISISEKLKSWIFKLNVSHNCVNSLLHILKDEESSVP